MNQATGGILSDHAIKMAVESGDIKIDPFRVEQLNPVSYDLTLGEGVSVYDAWVDSGWTGKDRPFYGRGFYPRNSWHDVKTEPVLRRFKMTPEAGWVLFPGIGYLMHTRESIYTKKFVPVIDGKSSIGRLFIQIHITAGFGDPGFNGQYTLEVVVTHPVRIYPGMRIAQVRFHTISGDIDNLYDRVGHYVGDDARGEIGSMAWRQFKKDD
jgi:dCTP deaminase